MTGNLKTLVSHLRPEYTKLNEPLSKHTTLKIGGPADVYYEPHTTSELISAARRAQELDIPITMLGWGSNVLISDSGIRGLVIRNTSRRIEILKDNLSPQRNSNKKFKKRLEQVDADQFEKSKKYLGRFDELDYDESECRRILVKLDSGLALPFAINHLIDKGTTGLQWYSRIPGTIGGAVANNIHGGFHFLSEVLESVKVLDPMGNITTLSHDELEMDYDKTRFHHSGEIILDATLLLYRGDTDKAKSVVKEWARRKRLQPQNSAGSVFANISHEEAKQINAPTTAAGWIIEHVLQMAGFRVGDAVVYPKHQNFITNEGQATARDYLAIIKKIIRDAKEKTGIKLRPEIFFLGFSKDELEEAYGSYT